MPQTLIGLPPTTVLVLNVAVDSVAYPDAVDLCLVGTYSAVAKAGGGFVWDDVLEYRVWCHPEGGSSDLDHGSDYYYPFATYAERRKANVMPARSTSWLATIVAINSRRRRCPRICSEKRSASGGGK